MRIPSSLLLIVLSFIIYALQTIPYIGIVLMIMGAPFWSVLLINGAFLGVLVEKFARNLHRAWLLLPALWFGSGVVLAGLDRVSLHQVTERYEQQNAAVTIAFDPDYMSLVEGNGALHVQPGHYQVPVTYSRSSDSSGFLYTARRLASSTVCEALREDRYRSAGIYTFGFQEPSDEIGGGHFAAGFCIVTSPEKPSKSMLLVEAETVKRLENWLPLELSKIAISSPSGSRHVLVGGQAHPRPWIPRPIMGCALNSGAPSWDCIMAFARSREPILSCGSRFGCEGKALTRALGIKEMTSDDHHATDSTELLIIYQGLAQRVVDEELATLDRAIADPTIDLTFAHFDSLEKRIDLIAPRLDGIVTAIEKGLVLRGNAGLNAQAMFDLLKTLPPGALSAFVGRLEALRHTDPWFTHDFRPPVQFPEVEGEPIIVQRER